MGNYTVGLVGAGGIANSHLPAWLALGVDVVVFSIDGAAPALVERHGGGRVVDSYEELLAASDAVDICTPTFTHKGLVLEAAEAGKDIVCEKPLALTEADSTDMIEACDRAGVQLYPAHVVRFFPEYVAMHDAITDGELGRLAVQRFLRAGSAPAAPWFSQQELSGGLVMDQMIHDLDFARWNAGEVTQVYATQSPSLREDGAAEPRTAQVILTHASGAVSYVNGVWSSNPIAFQTRFEVAGDAGLLQHDSLANPPLAFNGSDEEVSGFQPSTPFGESPYLTELREFYHAFLGGPAPRVDAADGLAAVALAAAALRSIETAAPVTLAASTSTSTSTSNMNTIDSNTIDAGETNR
jgi:predicted dehydrogenase